MAKRVGVLLSGCGVMDGSEIHEAVCSMLALDRAGAEIICIAPDIEQASVVDHLKGQPVREKRNVMVEAARIARGRIRDVAQVKPSDLDALLLPGGFGAAKNLSSFADEGEKAKVDPGVAALLRGMHAAKKPIAALCIAPAVLAAALGREFHPELTIGDDADTARKLEGMGAKHVAAEATGVVVDRRNRIVTTPCYMLAARISEVAEGAEKAVKALLEMA
ncbi:MAG: isoprenoid biosynthesis glyoxalase ElbB [Planctomycetes bacterium]|nr:isoprenoid biosynthesis glyoxalase ElbB [Planctomycetota bacterium]